MKPSGIYLISSDSGKVYVGSTRSTVGFEKRWRYHMQDLLRGAHGNRYLMNHVKKHGIDTISFMPIERCPDSKLESRECYWIDAFRSMNPVYGFNLIGPRRGMVSDETRKRMSIARRAYKMTASHRKNISLALQGNTNSLGNRHSDETRRKISVAHAGRPSPLKGVPISASHRRSLKKRWERERALCPVRAKILKMYAIGITVEAIAKAVKCDKSWVSRVANRAGLRRTK